MIYFDNAATTEMSESVLEAMLPYLKHSYGNPGALYRLGREARTAINKAREQVAIFVGSTPEQIVFTSGGSEANNLAIIGCADHLRRNNKLRIVTDMSEHDSVLRAASRLENGDVAIDYAKVGADGRVDWDCLRSKITDNTGMVSVMAVNNETGAINPVFDIGQLCKRSGVLFMTDCVQAAGAIPLFKRKPECDFLTISSHKIHGPKGIGALYVKDKNILSPIISGGEHQEYGLRAGTENVAGIVGFGKACEERMKRFFYIQNSIKRFKTEFICHLAKYIYGGENSFIINGSANVDYPVGIISLTFPDVDAETLVLMADAKGVCVSAGSACRAHESTPSRALTSMGVRGENAYQTVRISFSELNTLNDIKRGAMIVAECVNEIRAFR